MDERHQMRFRRLATFMVNKQTSEQSTPMKSNQQGTQSLSSENVLRDMKTCGQPHNIYM